MKPSALVPLLLPALLGCCLATNNNQTTTTEGATTTLGSTTTVMTTGPPATTTPAPATTTAKLTTTAPTTPAPTTTAKLTTTAPTTPGLTTTPPASRATTTPAGTTPAATTRPEPPTSTANSTPPPTDKGTTAAGGSTTGGELTTTIRPTSLPQTTPGNPVTVWEVLGGPDNTTCQKMQFNADITATYYDTNNMLKTVMISIPPASNATGDCSSAVERTFSLAFVPQGGMDTWMMSFFFTANKTSKDYQLRSIRVQLSYGDLINSTGKGQGTYYFSSSGRPLAGISAPSGKSFACDSGRVQSDGKEQLSVLLTQLRLQPFANEAGGDFGESVQCPYPTAPPPVTQEPMDSSWMYVGIAFIVLFSLLLIATGAFCVYVKKHKSQSSDSYSLMETY